MPLDLGHDAARLVPALRLIGEAGIVAPYFVWQSPERALEQVADPLLQDPIGRQPHRVADALCFKKFVYLGDGEGGIAPEIQALDGPPVAGNHRLQHRAPIGGAVHVPPPQGQRSTSPNWLNRNSGW